MFGIDVHGWALARYDPLWARNAASHCLHRLQPPIAALFLYRKTVVAAMRSLMSYAVFCFLQSLQRTSESGNSAWKRACWTWKKLAGSGSPLPKLWKVQSSCNSLTMSAGSACWHEAWRRLKIQLRLPIPLLPPKSARPMHNQCSLLKITQTWSGLMDLLRRLQNVKWYMPSFTACTVPKNAGSNMFLLLSWFCAPTCSILLPPASVTTAFNAKGLGESWGLQWSAWHPASTNFSELCEQYTKNGNEGSCQLEKGSCKAWRQPLAWHSATWNEIMWRSNVSRMYTQCHRKQDEDGVHSSCARLLQNVGAGGAGGAGGLACSRQRHQHALHRHGSCLAWQRPGQGPGSLRDPHGILQGALKRGGFNSTGEADERNLTENPCASCLQIHCQVYCLLPVKAWHCPNAQKHIEQFQLRYIMMHQHNAKLTNAVIRSTNPSQYTTKLFTCRCSFGIGIGLDQLGQSWVGNGGQKREPHFGWHPPKLDLGVLVNMQWCGLMQLPSLSTSSGSVALLWTLRLCMTFLTIRL